MIKYMGQRNLLLAEQHFHKNGLNYRRYDKFTVRKN